ncbi:MAG: addiction module toxin RelE [Deltaproteobacteria bacterium RIFCSPHIGHO2_12_FULL_43_9]|nr:MAG: addiction module toxin RelE [Deltaproteobacteria bacterium RIFCSPHIGHO2_12_FULL_43_9]
MIYKIDFTRAARKQFLGFPEQVQIRLEEKIDKLAKDPRPNGVEKLSGLENIYRIRIGKYRVIYNIQDEVLIVLVVKIGHRKEVYRR